MFKTGQIYQILFYYGVHTHIEIVSHTNGLGFKSLIASINDPSMHLEILDHHMVILYEGKEPESDRATVLAEMEKNIAQHLQIWQLLKSAEQLNAEEITIQIKATLN